MKETLLTEEILLSYKGIVRKGINNYKLKGGGKIYFNIEDGDWENPSLDIFVKGVYLRCVETQEEFEACMYWLLGITLARKLQ